MKIVSLKVNLYLYDVYTRKEGRRILKSVVERSRNTFSVSAADVSNQDLINHATLGFALVTNNYRHGEQIMHKIMNLLDRRSEIEVLSHEIDYL